MPFFMRLELRVNMLKEEVVAREREVEELRC
jgi:hypothetical protein